MKFSNFNARIDLGASFRASLRKRYTFNQIYYFDVKNQDHPSGYFVVLEYVGDHKGRLVRNKDKDFLNDYAPEQIMYIILSYQRKRRN